MIASSSSSLLVVVVVACSLLGGLSYGFVLGPSASTTSMIRNINPPQHGSSSRSSMMLRYEAKTNANNDSDRYFKGNNNNDGKKKKRRFAQDIHHSPTSLEDFGNTNNNNNNNIATVASDSNAVSNEKKKKKKNSNTNDNNIFLQRGKSMEELERTMTERYGTKLDKWAFDANGNDSEYELVFDDNNNNNNNNSNSNKKRSSNHDQKKEDATANRPIRRRGKFKGRPVMDPWDQTSSTNSDGGDEGGGSGVVVEKKEKHVQRKLAAAAAAGIQPPKAKKIKEPFVRREPIFNQPKTEFYDEDDVGYEDDNNSNSDDVDDDDFYNRVISPQPVGGRGKKPKTGIIEPPRPSKKPTTTNDNDNDNDSGGGFFSKSTQMAASTAGTTTAPTNPKESNHQTHNDNGATKPSAPLETNTPTANKNATKNRNHPPQVKKVIVKSPPLLDANGKKMFLTLDHVPSICATATNNNNDDDDNEEDAATETKDVSWEDIGITHPTLLENLRMYMSCPTPLPVQIRSSTAILSNKDESDDTTTNDDTTNNDIIISTPTGSGKTLAFLVPLVQQLLDDELEQELTGATNDKKKKKTKKTKKAKQLRAVVVAPGRELASQIIQVSRDLLRNTGMSCQLAIGGTPFTRTMEQIRKKKPTILVGTPGRLAELIVGTASNDNNGRNNKRIKIPATNHIVLDECDALLGTNDNDENDEESNGNYNGYNNPHAEPTNAILRALQRQHSSSLQTILCSATATDLILTSKDDKDDDDNDDDTNTVVQKKNKYKDYEMIQLPHQEGVTATTTSPTALHGIIHVPHRRFALDTLKRILHTHPMPAQVLIFVNTPHRVKIIVEKLAEMGIIAAPFTGVEQKQDRTEVNQALREGYVGIVVATEMAARGIDAPFLTHVINYDLPTDASHYAHRAGRVARGGRPGIVINMTTSAKERNVPYNKFAKPLNLEQQMFIVEARDGKIPIVAVSNQSKDDDSSD